MATANQHSEPGPSGPFPRKPGAYVLILQLAAGELVQVGRLGLFEFPTGFYAYAGSALGPGGLAGRLGRHLRAAAGRRPHWHLDYLLPHARIFQAWYILSVTRREHHWAKQMSRMPGADIIVSRFGASDCRCPTHLYHFERPPDPEFFRRLAADPLMVVIDLPGNGLAL